MIRSIPIITFTVSLLLWSAQVFCAEPEGLFAAMQDFGQRVGLSGTGGNGSSMSARPIALPPLSLPSLATPTFPQTTGFVGAFFRPARYQQVQPLPTGFGYPQSPGVPPAIYPPEMDPYLAYPPGYDPQNTVPERIVYVPYAAPPPIYVERFAKVLRPSMSRRGDAYLQEYPEMPLNMYTTRGPRDFLAPNPPSIGY